MSEKIKFKKYNDLEDLSPSELKKAEKHFKNLTNPHSIFFGGQDRIAFDNARKAQLEEVRAKLSSLGSQGAPGSLKKQKL